MTFFKYLKLTNGENIIVTTDHTCCNFKDEKTISVFDAVLVSSVKIANGPYLIETYVMQPWIKLAKNDIIDIPTENILVAVDLEESVEEQYKTYLNDMQTGNVSQFVADEIDGFEEDYVYEDEIEEDEQTQSQYYKSTIH